MVPIKKTEFNTVTMLNDFISVKTVVNTLIFINHYK